MLTWWGRCEVRHSEQCLAPRKCSKLLFHLTRGSWPFSTHASCWFISPPYAFHRSWACSLSETTGPIFETTLLSCLSQQPSQGSPQDDPAKSPE